MPMGVWGFAWRERSIPSDASIQFQKGRSEGEIPSIALSFSASCQNQLSNYIIKALFREYILYGLFL